MNIKIGNTPVIKVKYEYNGKENYIYTKLEFYNIIGSIKDRVAYYIIKKAYQEGKLKKGMEIVEATSGNTGISLSALGAFFGNPVHKYQSEICFGCTWWSYCIRFYNYVFNFYLYT